MSITEIAVIVDGTPVPIRDMFWVRINPEGCVVGSCLGEMAVSAEQAHKEFTTRQRDRERETRQGYRHELVTKQQWDATAHVCFTGKCEHRKAATA